MSRQLEPTNPIFKESQTYQNFHQRSKHVFAWRMGALIVQMLIGTWLLCGLRTDLKSLEKGINGPVFNLFVLANFGWSILMFVVANWAERSEARTMDRLWARKWIEKLADPFGSHGEVSGTATSWSTHDLVRELQVRFTVKGWESARHAYAALLAEGFTFREILEVALRRKDFEVAEYAIDHRLKAMRYAMNLVQSAPFAALVTTAGLLKFAEIVKAVNNPAFVLLTVYSALSMALIFVWLFRDRDPGQLVKPLSFVLGLIVLCGGAYEGLVTFRSMAQARLGAEKPGIDLVPTKASGALSQSPKGEK